jgi:hypothetical protein
MTGHPNLNMDTFDTAREYLRGCGFKVLCPAEHSRPYVESGEWPGDRGVVDAVMRWDVLAVMDCDVIYMLPGWEYSEGATNEHRLACWFRKSICYVGGVAL